MEKGPQSSHFLLFSHFKSTVVDISHIVTSVALKQTSIPSSCPLVQLLQRVCPVAGGPHRALGLKGHRHVATAHRETGTAMHEVRGTEVGVGPGDRCREAMAGLPGKEVLRVDAATQLSSKEGPNPTRSPSTTALAFLPSLCILQAKRTPFHPSKPPPGSSPPPDISAIQASICPNPLPSSQSNQMPIPRWLLFRCS